MPREQDPGPVFGSRATSSNLGWRLSLASLLLLAAAEISFAEQLGVELLSTTIASTTIAQESETLLDEIVVVGIREDDGTVRPQRLVNDHLLQQVLHDFEMRQELERDFEGRLESEPADDDRTGVRIGHNVAEEAREPQRQQSLELPMELVRPAIVISVDF